jgi:curved DNA-binding protein CbpA
MKTPYEVLRVPRNASDAMIRAAFRKAAKACHPDHNPGDPTAEQRLRQVIAANNILKRPQQRAAYDEYMRGHRRQTVRRFAEAAAASVLVVVSGSIVALMVWLLILSKTQEAFGPLQTLRIALSGISQPASQQVSSANNGKGPRDKDGGRETDDGPQYLQQTAGGLKRAFGPPGPQPLLAEEWERLQARGDPIAIWAFAARNPHGPESELARSKLAALIDTADDVSMLEVLRVLATDAIAKRVQRRLMHLGALAVAKEDSEVPTAPSSNSLLQTSVGETIKAIDREQPAAQNSLRRPQIPGKRRQVAKGQVTSHTSFKSASAGSRSTSACAGVQSCSNNATPIFGVGF